jgi:hypothetical protein
MHTRAYIEDEKLIGVEIAFRATSIGHVLGIVHDPLSRRVRRLITSYGPDGRRDDEISSQAARDLSDSQQ